MTFQFTHPGKGATSAGRPPSRGGRGFNSRTLGRVRLSSVIRWRWLHGVSIHAPWEGCDGIRQTATEPPYRFQFTHPGKGATSTPLRLARTLWFQFTHPGKGATSPCDHLCKCPLFQFTHPGKGATDEPHPRPPRLAVSIHAPWEGCD